VPVSPERVGGGGVSGDDGNIVQLYPTKDQADESAPVKSREGDPKQRYCRHHHVELDREARRVYCRACSVEVPAFDFLEELSRDFSRHVTAREEAERRATVARENLDELLREERNAKSRLRAARQKLAEIEPPAPRESTLRRPA
jgi:hypothetical protein